MTETETEIWIEIETIYRNSLLEEFNGTGTGREADEWTTRGTVSVSVDRDG